MSSQIDNSSRSSTSGQNDLRSIAQSMKIIEGKCDTMATKLKELVTSTHKMKTHMNHTIKTLPLHVDTLLFFIDTSEAGNCQPLLCHCFPLPICWKSPGIYFQDSSIIHV